MSKFIDQMKQVEAERERKRLRNKILQPNPVANEPQENRAAPKPDSKELIKEPPEVITKEAASADNDTQAAEKGQSMNTSPHAKNPAAHAVGLRAGFICLSICMAAFATFFYRIHYQLSTAGKANSIAIENLEKDLNHVKGALLDDEDKTTALELKVQPLGPEIDKLSQQAVGVNSQVSVLEKTQESQGTAIENLIKAKNTLYNKVSTLEATLESLKDKNNKKGQ